MTALDDFKKFVADAERGQQYKNWANDNCGKAIDKNATIENPVEGSDLAKWYAFRDAILAGQRPNAPIMNTAHGDELIDAGVMYLHYNPAPTPPPAPTFTGKEFRLGDPAKGFDSGGHTSTGWEVQAGVPSHVTFSPDKWFSDRSVIDCLIKPADPILYGQQRSQIIRGTDGILAPGGPGKWLSVPFRTNPGYKPQSKTSNPNFNCLGLCLHEPNDYYAYPSPTVKTTTPQAPFNVVVCTTDPSTYPAVFLPEPRLGFFQYGGIPDAQWYSKGKRWLGPVFQPSHLYVLDMYVLLSSDPTKGQLEIWVDGVQYVKRTTLSTTWKNLAGQDASLYFCCQNYRPKDSEITWDNVVSWCGIRVGDDRESTSFLSL